MPFLINYGHVLETDINDILRATKINEIVLKNYRGISSLLPSVQAAEGFLRKEYNNVLLGSLKFISAIKTDQNYFCTFQLLDGNRKTISVVRQKSSYFGYLTCTLKNKSYSIEYITKEILF